MNPSARWFVPSLALALGAFGAGTGRAGLPVHPTAPLEPDRAMVMHGSSHHRHGADPLPIPGGFAIPGGPFIHVFAPGPPELGLMGLDVEPNVITNFKGFAAIAYPTGTATDAAGKTYEMANDIRVFRGEYVAGDGTRHHGTFGFI